MSEFLRHAHAMAECAGEVLRRYYRQPVQCDVKSDASPVTQADREVERVLRAYVAEHLPSHGVIGEEEASVNEGAEHVWVFDPIDGTRSFLAGRPLFTTLIALTQQGRSVLGVIDQPITRERWVGAQGQPSTLNGTPIQTRPCGTLRHSLLASTSPHYYAPEGEAAFHRLRGACRDVLYGGDAYLYGLLAAGHVDVIAEEGLKWYDAAALVPVIEGAGGCITDWQGHPLTAQNHSRVLAVSDAALLPEAIALLQA